MHKILQNRFGTSPRLVLANGDWLEQGMHAKTVKFNISQGGLPPETNWEDRSAALALIDNAPAKALATILLWGGNTVWDWSTHFDTVIAYLANEMLKRCDKDGKSAPIGCTHDIQELARLMARMTLHFELYDLWSFCTVPGRLLFSGIDINDSTYTNGFLKYQRVMLEDIKDLILIADKGLFDYRNSLNDDLPVDDVIVSVCAETGRRLPCVGEVWSTPGATFIYEILTADDDEVAVINLETKRGLVIGINEFLNKAKYGACHD